MSIADDGSEQPTMDLTPFPTAQALAERYEILQEVGAGGMGVVYHARDRETGAVVALKVLHPAVAGHPELLERFKAELLLARKITHKNVCRVYDLNRFGKVAAISMEFIEGESLRSLLKRVEVFSVGRGMNILGQILAGLREAHAQGVVHRDLKPENILIARDGTVKVMDFGIARSLEGGATSTGTLVGTPAYMSPEQAEGKPADQRSDIYSLGLIMYEMFTGQGAFRADTPVAYALKQIHDTPPPARQFEPHLPEFLDRAIQKCLEKDPTRRFQTVTELEAALREQPEAKAPAAVVEPSEVPLPVHLTRWQRWDWALVVLAALGLALFFPFFHRTSLAPRSQVTFDRSVLLRIAQEYAGRMGAPVGQRAEIGTVNLWRRYNYVAGTAGARSALELANNPVPYWLWYVDWENGTHVAVDHRGSLVHFWRDFAPGFSPEKLPPEEAKPLAEKAVREFLRRDPAELTLEFAGAYNWREHLANVFTWSDPHDYHGLKRRYEVRLVGREVAELSEVYDSPSEYDPRDVAWQLLPGVILWLLLVSPAIAYRRFVNPTARWRVFHVVAGFAGGAWMGSIILFQELALKFIFGLILGLAIALGTFFLTIALERFVRRFAATKLSTYVRLFGRGALSPPCGLAVLRGTLVGLALLGLDTLLVWVVTTNLRGRLDTSSHSFLQTVAFLGSSFPALQLILHTLYQGLSLVSILPILASLTTRLVRQPWLSVVLTAGLAGATLTSPLFNMGSVQPYHLKVVVLFLDFVVLAWTFSRYDMLTLLAAVFTFAFCWQNHLLLVIKEPLGAVAEWITFGVWGALVLLAAGIAFQAALRAARQRLAQAFE